MKRDLPCSETLVFQLADALQMDLYQQGASLRGAQDVRVVLDGYEAHLPVTACSDHISKTAASLFVHVKCDYWLYMISSAAGVWAFPFDGSKVKIRVGAEKEFGLGDPKGTLAALKPALAAVAYEFVGEHAEWKEIDAVDIVGRLSG